MPYIPHTNEDREEMLREIGVSSIDELFEDVPENLKLQRRLAVPPAMDEHRLFLHLKSLADQNVSAANTDWYLGAGLYDRFIPASVGAVISRGEFLTAYTPYQPELSQGYLQTIYEFQSMIASLYDMDVANASMYDGATAMAEAALLSCAHTGRNGVVVSEAVHPHYLEVLRTYAWAADVEVHVLSAEDGVTQDASAIRSDAACVIIQYPNFFGCIENLTPYAEWVHSHGALLIVVSDPIAMGVLTPPGELGADIVVGEGQPLGVPMGYGGPLVGLFACKSELVRRLPGRIVGRTTDASGRTGYTMTLRTREQDIRRERATSNICTNEALMALAATVYLSALGKNGLRSIAESSVRNTQYAIEKFKAIGATLRFPGAKVFGEFVLNLPKDATVVRDALLKDRIMAGLPLGDYFKGIDNALLVAITETKSREQIDRFAERMAVILSS